MKLFENGFATKHVSILTILYPFGFRVCPILALCLRHFFISIITQGIWRRIGFFSTKIRHSSLRLKNLHANNHLKKHLVEQCDFYKCEWIISSFWAALLLVILSQLNNILKTEHDKKAIRRDRSADDSILKMISCLIISPCVLTLIRRRQIIWRQCKLN